MENFSIHHEALARFLADILGAKGMSGTDAATAVAEEIRRRCQDGGLCIQHLDVDAGFDELAQGRFELAGRDVLGL